ncbi:hypothetical protein MPC4_380003 [Methylocella tundrae]|uniref:Uncharacterized protein n=1 Tax=Methylocella tundrae TaxID=227605 RepID=A0A8B6MA33_METTU|nr:hypothetical protein MPC4_380003 [Methylocella tundrae]
MLSNDSIWRKWPVVSRPCEPCEESGWRRSDFLISTEAVYSAMKALPYSMSLASPFGLAPTMMLVGLGHLTWFVLEKWAIMSYIVAQGD